MTPTQEGDRWTPIPITPEAAERALAALDAYTDRQAADLAEAYRRTASPLARLAWRLMDLLGKDAR